MANAWHDISPGNDVRNEFKCIIEIPLGSNVTYELDKESGLIKMDRVLYSPFSQFCLCVCFGCGRF